MKFFSKKDANVHHDSTKLVVDVGTRSKNIPSFVATRINEHLKPLGFIKQSQSFYRTANDVIHIINLQASSYNNIETGKFYVNFAVFSDKIYEIEHGEPAPKVPHEYDGQLRKRVGPKQAGGDNWWEYDKQTDLAKLGDDIGSYIAGQAPQYFETLESLKSISENQFTESHSNNFHTVYGNVTEAIAYGLLGDKKLAYDKFMAYVEKNTRINIPIKCRIQAMAQDLGISLALTDTEGFTCVGFYIPMLGAQLVKDERRTRNKLELYLRHLEDKESGFVYYRGLRRKNGYLRVAFCTKSPEEVVQYITARKDKLPLDITVDRNDSF